MKEKVAEELLARVLGWSQEDVARERPALQAMAAYKYDEYQQFSPGMRFVESFACWLSQFNDLGERRAAYRFVKEELIFCSSAEMNHFVETAYPDHIRPVLIRQAAGDLGVSPFQVARVAGSVEFRVRQRQCLVLGLSDGARIDDFRRANRDLNHEQIWQTHELSAPRIDELLEKVATHVGALRGAAATGCKFRTIVLLDDFSASGTSYYMEKPDGRIGGKIAKFHAGLTSPGDALAKLVNPADCEVIVLVYVATQHAFAYLTRQSNRLWTTAGIPCQVKVVQLIPGGVKIARGGTSPICPLADAYYDHGVWDESLAKGGTNDAKYGYAACGLPLVLHHNSPNNSIFLIWSYEELQVRGLFPRVQRHKAVS